MFCVLVLVLNTRKKRLDSIKFSMWNTTRWMVPGIFLDQIIACNMNHDPVILIKLLISLEEKNHPEILLAKIASKWEIKNISYRIVVYMLLHGLRVVCIMYYFSYMSMFWSKLTNSQLVKNHQQNYLLQFHQM